MRYYDSKSTHSNMAGISTPNANDSTLNPLFIQRQKQDAPTLVLIIPPTIMVSKYSWEEADLPTNDNIQ